MNDLAPVEVAAFGKLPWAGDFLQVGNPPGKEVFLNWLEQGVALGASRGDVWKQWFDAGAQKGFVFPVGREYALVGVLAPSRDQVGRRFPFVIYAAVPSSIIADSVFTLPLLLGSFLHASGTWIGQLQQEEMDLRQVVTQMAPPDFSAAAAQVEGYLEWTRGALIRNAGNNIFRHEHWREALAYALYTTWESVRPFHGQEFPPSPLSVRFPLGTGLAGAAALWMHTVRLCAGWKSTIPCSVWSFDAERPSLTVQLGPVSPHMFADVWEADPKNDNLSNLLTMPLPSVDYLGQVRPDLADLIHGDGVTVHQLLQTILP